MDSDQPKFPATVVHVIGGDTIVVNRGANDGVKLNQRFLVYALSTSPILDPDTGESLGLLEIVRGSGKVVHVQERMATVQSDMKRPSTKTIRRSNSPMAIFAAGREEEEIVNEAGSKPFDSPSIGDKAKPI